MKIATCKNRKTTIYQNKETDWQTFLKRISTTIRTKETVAEYRAMTRDQQADIKDVGGFVAGELRNGRRNNQSVISRSMITLDADFADQNAMATIETLYDFRCAIYTTHKHTPEKPKFRWIIPLDREVTPEEYEAIARRQAAFLGMEEFDDTTYQPARMMFWPSTSSDGEFICKEIDGPILKADDVLAEYRDWHDISTWPRSTRETEIRTPRGKKPEDPLSKPGWIGAFCRTYTIQEAILKFLPDEYTPTAHENRWTYTKGSTAGGLVIYDDRFAYSNHSTDPASQQLCNAFDLVRIHKWPDDPDSQSKMLDFVSKDAETAATLAKEKQHEAAAAWDDAFTTEEKKRPEGPVSSPQETSGDEDWTGMLELDKKGEIKPTTDNIVIIMQHDPALKNSVGGNDLFLQKPVKKGKLPWWDYNANNPGWDDSDDAGLRYYLEKCYHVVAKGKVDDAVAFVHEQNSFHPVRDYLAGLKWDGKARLDTIFIDYLGAEDSPYNRAVARKIFTAAVARVYDPGCKMDYMPVLVGKQGIGKSHLLSIMGGEWFSDSITSIQGKEGYEALQGSWIVEWAELSAAKKSDIESMKQFISKRDDRYRKAYARRVTDNPRQCVFIGTTNDDEFLRDYTGNRRFWPIGTDGDLAMKDIFRDLPGERDQIWAEAVQRYHEHEPLFLPSELQTAAAEVQEEHTFRSVREDLVRDYLDRRLPENWKDMELYERIQWLENPENEGTVVREKVCLLEIWCEVFNGSRTNFTNSDQRELKAIMDRVGWERAGNGRFGFYGFQRAFRRPGDRIMRYRSNSGDNGGQK